ncbi:MAG: ABC transporter permease [Vicinamibacterales bacterium]
MPILADLKYALRLLARSPLFTVTAVASVALGIGATAAIFSVADALLLRPPDGVRQIESVIEIGRVNEGETSMGLDNFAYPVFADLREASHSFTAMAATRFEPQPVSLEEDGQSARVFAGLVSGAYFDVLGTHAALGRFFLPAEDEVPGARPVVVLSHAFWQQHFGGAPDIAGRSLELNGLDYTVVGVAEAGFTGHTFLAADMWVPMAMEAAIRGEPDSKQLTNERTVWITAIGRLAPGVTRAQAQAEMTSLMTAIKERRPGVPRRHLISLSQAGRVPSQLRLPLSAFLALLFALTAIVLAIACTNVAGMLLARAMSRRREVATRLAVGASRGRLIVQLLTESMVLFGAGGVAGLLCALGCVRLLGAYLPSLPLGVGLALDLTVNPRVVLFALALAMATGLLFGLAPARQALRLDLAPSLHGQNATADRRRFALRHVLVVAQVALSLLLLVTTGLFLRALQAAADIDAGFDMRDVEIVSLDTRLAGARGAAAVDLTGRIVSRVRTMAGVTAAATGNVIPLQGSVMGLGGLRVPGVPGEDGTDWHSADWDVVSDGYFEALRMPIVEGRGFAAADSADAPFVAVINQAFARRMWGDGPAIGRTIYQRREVGDTEGRPLTIVGVVHDAKTRTLWDGPRPFIYVPMAQQPMSQVELFVRHEPGRAIAADVRAIVAAEGQGLPVLTIQSLEAAAGIGLLPQRLAAWVAGAVGVVGLLLAGLGLYAVVAFSVASRTREIAVRMALGASRESVLSLVLRQGAWLATVGGAAGLALAAGAGLLARALLLGVAPLDPLSFGGAAAVLAAVTLLATWLPARRAAGTDPAAALRTE